MQKKEMPTQEKLPVRTRLVPSYFERFHCIADRCQDNCCHGWKIAFSKKDYLKIKRAAKPAALEEVTKQAMHRLPDGRRTEAWYAEFLATNGPCPFQSETGLCQLQLECGEAVLPRVCREFPRVSAYTPMGREETLSTACEAVVELLWELPEGVDFIEEDLPREKWRFYFATPENEAFPTMRAAVIDILQARQFSLARRLMILGIVLENARDTWPQFDLRAWHTRVQLLLAEPSLTQSLEPERTDLKKFLAENTRIVLSLETKDARLQQQLEAMGVSWDTASEVGQSEVTVRMEFRQDYYLEAEEAFARCFGDIEYFFENILVNMAFWQKVPQVGSAEALWKSYVTLCSIYSFFRFFAVLYGGTDPSRERLFRSVVLASRGLLHSESRRNTLRDRFFENQNSTLAHMVVLLQG